MDRELCLENARLCRIWASRTDDPDARESFVRLAQTWLHQAELFLYPDQEGRYKLANAAAVGFDAEA
jgi:hypothetical protein